MTKWEYLVEEASEDNYDSISEERLNELGLEGWRMVSAGWHVWGGMHLQSAVFRRPLPEAKSDR